MNIKNILRICYLWSLFFLSGCAGHSIKENFGDYTSSSIEEASIKPSPKRLNQIKKGEGSVSIAVAKFSLPKESASSDYGMAKNVNLSQVAAEIVDDVVTTAGAKLVSKDEVKEIIEYIKNSEKQGKKYKNSDNIDFAILGEINSVSQGIKKSTATVIYEKAMGKTLDKLTNTSNEKNCTYEALVAGTLAIYKFELAQPSRFRSIRLKGDATEMVHDVCNDKFRFALVKEAMEKAIYNIKDEIQTLLSVDTYVIEKRMLDGDSIFLISAGENLGLHPGVSVEFFNLKERTDLITGEIRNDEIMVGKGVVTDKIEKDRSWVLVNSGDDKGILLWNIARTHFVNCEELLNKIKPECINR